MLRSLTLPAPRVFEDIESRPVQVQDQAPDACDATGLLTVRSGPEGGQLALMGDVSTHAIGSRETDLAAWVRGWFVLPSQDGRLLRVLDPAADWAELFTVDLPGRATMTAGLKDGSGVAMLLADGQVVLAGT